MSLIQIMDVSIKQYVPSIEHENVNVKATVVSWNEKKKIFFKTWLNRSLYIVINIIFL